MVRRAHGVCVSEQAVDAKAKRLLEYCEVRKRAMMKNVPYHSKEMLAVRPGVLTVTLLITGGPSDTQRLGRTECAGCLR